MTVALEARIGTVALPGHARPVLSDVVFSVEEGTFVVVAGHTASGKSTLCHCLTGAIPRFFTASLQGRVLVGGRDVGATPLPAMAGAVGYLMQEPQSQLIEDTVEEDVAFGPCNLGLARDEVRRRVREALETVGITRLSQRDPRTLSGGEAQRAVLAGVLALGTRVLVLDEPLAELDPTGRLSVLRHLRRLVDRGLTVVFATAVPQEAAPWADRVLTLASGRLVDDRPGGGGAGRIDAGEIEAGGSDVGSRLGDGDPGAEAASCRGAVVDGPGRGVVEFGACGYVHPGGAAAFVDVDLVVGSGQVVGLTGPNGVGKSTLVRHVNGLLRPTHGHVRVLGMEPRGRALGEVRRRVGMIFQNPDRQLLGDTVAEEVAFGLRVRGVGAVERERRVGESLASLGLADLRGTHPHRLSRGQRQLVAVAGVLACRPEVVVADESTAGLDAEAAASVGRGLRGVAAAGGAAIVVTHDARFADAWADRVVRMRRSGDDERGDAGPAAGRGGHPGTVSRP